MPNPQKLEAAWPEQKAVAADGGPKDWFGSWVAISGTTALVGAKNATVNGQSGQGAVYVFKKSGGVWKQVQKLVASDGAAADQFGTSIALLGKTAIITAPIAKINGNLWQGAAYVFSLTGNNWIEKQKLVVSNGTEFETFGTSVALNSTSAFIGAGGANHHGQYFPRRVYVFRLVQSDTNDAWTESQILDSPYPDDETSFFGASVAVSDATALVGARASTVAGNVGQGIVFVYTESNGVWILSAKLIASDGAARDNFGISIALQGTTALIGAPGVVIDGNISEGAVYRFDQSGGNWLQTQKFTAQDGTANTLFGASVSLWKNTALVGAYATDSYRGAAYLFQYKAGAWTQTHKLIASHGLAGDVFGYNTALDAATALVGAYNAEVAGVHQQGAVYFYSRPRSATPTT